MTHFRLKHFAAMMLIGDGVMAVISPEYDSQAWKKGPAPWQNFMKALRNRPVLTRVIGVAEIAAGVAWAIGAEQHTTRFAPPAMEERAQDLLVR